MHDDQRTPVLATDEGSIPEVVAAMSLAEKAALCAGRFPFETHPVERLGVPALLMTDGHNGINTYHLMANIIARLRERRGESGKASPSSLPDGLLPTCFPTGIVMGAT